MTVWVGNFWIFDLDKFLAFVCDVVRRNDIGLATQIFIWSLVCHSSVGVPWLHGWSCYKLQDVCAFASW